MAYNINTNYLEIMSGSNIPTSKVYTEVAKSIDESTPKAMAKVKKFIMLMEDISNENVVKDNRISSTKGNIKQFSGYENIKSVMEFLKLGLGNVDIVRDLYNIYDALEKYQPLYSEGYSKNVKLIILEYESSLYQLVTGLSLAMATELDIVQTGFSIKIQKKHGFTHGIIHKTSKDLAKQLSSKNHKEYLETLLKMSEDIKVSPVTESSTFYEGTVLDILQLVDAICGKASSIGKFAINTLKRIKGSFFGIIPIIRGILYFRYNRKADTIKNLEQQAAFIQQNIERIEKRTNINPEEKDAIIKKQQAYVEAYKKKAEKLRAELSETEKEAATEIKKADEEIKNSDDDDFVLESSLGNFNLLKTE